MALLSFLCTPERISTRFLPTAMSNYYNGYSYPQGSSITTRNCTYKEVNGLCIKRTKQNIVRVIGCGNVQNVDMRMHKTINEEIHVDESSESESDNSKMRNTPKGKAMSSRDTVAPSNSLTLHDMINQPNDQFDPLKALELLRTGKLGALANPAAQRASGASSSSYGGSARPNAGYSSYVPPTGSNDSYQDPQSVPFIAAIDNLNEMSDFNWAEEANADRMKGFTDAARDVVVKASKAGDGQHLIPYGSRVLQHTTMHNGVPIDPKPRYQKINGTYEVFNDETHRQYIDAYNVVNVHCLEHTEVKSSTIVHSRR
ncbi:hypothetical protein BJ165DRAFT_431251 [Panaeolus papilionaceus]|nr:hypothetical protein BJ165DRAFT_431251 [Panaeolus papilionaceus]